MKNGLSPVWLFPATAVATVGLFKIAELLVKVPEVAILAAVSAWGVWAWQLGNLPIYVTQAVFAL